VSRSWRVTRGAQAESTEIVSTGAGNPKASVARIKVAGRSTACGTVSLLSEGRTGTHEGRRANNKKSFTAAADLEEEADDDDDDGDDDDDDGDSDSDSDGDGDEDKDEDEDENEDKDEDQEKDVEETVEEERRRAQRREEKEENASSSRGRRREEERQADETGAARSHVAAPRIAISRYTRVVIRVIRAYAPREARAYTRAIYIYMNTR